MKAKKPMPKKPPKRQKKANRQSITMHFIKLGGITRREGGTVPAPRPVIRGVIRVIRWLPTTGKVGQVMEILAFLFRIEGGQSLLTSKMMVSRKGWSWLKCAWRAMAG